jgi:hypothetical protein
MNGLATNARSRRRGQAASLAPEISADLDRAIRFE